MDDVQFFAVAEAIIDWVEERFGKVAAWSVAAVLVLMPFVAITAIVAVVVAGR